jgi:N-acetylglucosaminyldiphosphoundecaprenol N-acetyl-beta-D-mannosaminyltransferase
MKNNILGIKIDNFSFIGAVLEAKKLVEQKKGALISTVNVEFIMRAQKDEEFKTILNLSDMALPDSAGVVWAGRFLGVPFLQRIPGVDFSEVLVGLSALWGWKVYLLGGKDGVAKTAKEYFEKKYAGLQIVGAESGGFFSELGRGESDDELVERINKSGANLLLVALGAGKQEKWLFCNREKLHCVGIGVGGSFDFWAGKSHRAPFIFRRFGIEWLWRLLLEPRRAKRMLALPAFIVKVVKSRFH